jgi:hypothetical protein
VAYLLKARSVEPEKQPLLGNGCVTHNSRVTFGSYVFCAVPAGAIYQEPTVMTAIVAGAANNRAFSAVLSLN